MNLLQFLSVTNCASIDVTIARYTCFVQCDECIINVILSLTKIDEAGERNE
jgi:hypothetical protein